MNVLVAIGAAVEKAAPYLGYACLIIGGLAGLTWVVGN